MNLTIYFIVYLLNVIIVVTRLNSSVVHLIFVIVVLIVYSIFISIIGMCLNTKYLNLQLNDEISVIKHRISDILINIMGIVLLYNILVTARPNKI